MYINSDTTVTRIRKLQFYTEIFSKEVGKWKRKICPVVMKVLGSGKFPINFRKSFTFFHFPTEEFSWRKKYPLISKFRNILHFVPGQRVYGLPTREICNSMQTNNENFNQSLPSAHKASSLPIVGSRNVETIWRNDSDICGSFERQKKRGKTDIFPGNFAVLVARLTK